MSEFLRNFDVKDNQALYDKIHSDPEARDKINDFINEANTYKEKLNAQPRLTSNNHLASFVQKYNLHQSNKTHLLMTTGSLQFVKSVEIEPYLFDTPHTPKKIALEMMQTESANMGIILHPKDTVKDRTERDLQQQFNAIRKTANHLGFTFIEHVIADSEKIDSLEHHMLVNYRIPNKGLSPADMPTLTFNYQDGFREFLEFYANEKLVGKNLWADNDEIKRLLKFGYEHYGHEKAVVLLLDEQSNVTSVALITEGTRENASVPPLKVMDAVLKENAAEFALFHNHPLGIAKASDADINLTNKLTEISTTLDAPLVEHFIIANDVYELSKDPYCLKLRENAENSQSRSLDMDYEI